MSSPFNPDNNPVSTTPAPTGVQVADNPGAYAGTSFDPLIQAVSCRAVSLFSGDGVAVFPTWGEWFKVEPFGALDYFTVTHNGHKLNFNNLSGNQRQSLGL